MDQDLPISMTLGSEAIGSPRTPSAVVADAVAAERAGYRSGWCVHFSRGIDSLTTLAAAATATATIRIGVGVVPAFPRHPASLAQSAATIQALAAGRFVLGVGVSHRPVIEGMHGLDFSDPLGRLREYLTVLTALLRDGTASFVGRYYRVEGSIDIPGTDDVPVLVGALAPAMSELGAELADGVITWLAGPRSLERVVAPAMQRGAERAGRDAPRLVAAVPVGLAASARRRSSGGSRRVLAVRRAHQLPEALRA